MPTSGGSSCANGSASASHDWKLLADCSAIDFRQAAEGRRVHAAGALANAARFDTYAAACEEHKAARFADLPEKVQAELLLGGAGEGSMTITDPRPADLVPRCPDFIRWPSQTPLRPRYTRRPTW
jgi:hypothetical protein